MAVGASKATVVADKDGFFSVKNKMQVGSYLIIVYSSRNYVILFIITAESIFYFSSIH